MPLLMLLRSWLLAQRLQRYLNRSHDIGIGHVVGSQINRIAEATTARQQTTRRCWKVSLITGYPSFECESKGKQACGRNAAQRLDSSFGGGPREFPLEAGVALRMAS